MPGWVALDITQWDVLMQPMNRYQQFKAFQEETKNSFVSAVFLSSSVNPFA